MNVQRIEESLGDIVTWVESTATPFIEEQAPLVVEEIIAVGQTNALILTIMLSLFWLIPSLGLVTGILLTCRELRRGQDPFVGLAVAVISAFVAVFAAVATFEYVSAEVYKPWVAPRLYVLERVTDMLNPS